MLDDLNLADIKAELQRKAARRTVLRRVVGYIFWGLLVIDIALTFLLSMSLQSPRTTAPLLKSIDWIPNLITLGMLILLINWFIFIGLAYWDDRERAIHANTHLPKLLPDIPIQVHARIMWFEIGSLLVIGIAFVLGLMAQKYFYALIIVTLVFLFQYVPRYWLRLEVRLLYKGALAQGDYDATLWRVDKFLRWIPRRMNYLNAKGVMLLMAGRSEEAEGYFRQILKHGQGNPYYLTAFMVNLGAALVRQKRYDEAFPLLEAAVQITPEHLDHYVVLAAYYLEQNIYPERALELMEYVLEGSTQPKTNHFLEGYVWSTRKAAEARAAALTGRATRAEAGLEAAFAAADKEFLPGVADIHLQAGYIRQSQGDFATARDHFSRAHEFDPNGYSGKTAAQELSALPS